MNIIGEDTKKVLHDFQKEVLNYLIEVDFQLAELHFNNNHITLTEIELTGGNENLSFLCFYIVAEKVNSEDLIEFQEILEEHAEFLQSCKYLIHFMFCSELDIQKVIANPIMLNRTKLFLKLIEGE